MWAEWEGEVEARLLALSQVVSGPAESSTDTLVF